MRVRELRISYVVRGETIWDGRKAPTSPRDLAEILVPILQNEPVEVFGLLCLTTKHRVICYHELARGTLDTAIVSPREVYKAALLVNAAAIVIAHNHPSGDPTPSWEDIALTRRLKTAGEVLDITLLDHLVIGAGNWHSFKEARQL